MWNTSRKTDVCHTPHQAHLQTNLRADYKSRHTVLRLFCSHVLITWCLISLIPPFLLINVTLNTFFSTTTKLLLYLALPRWCNPWRFFCCFHLSQPWYPSPGHVAWLPLRLKFFFACSFIYSQVIWLLGIIPLWGITFHLCLWRWCHLNQKFNSQKELNVAVSLFRSRPAIDPLWPRSCTAFG